MHSQAAESVTVSALGTEVNGTEQRKNAEAEVLVFKCSLCCQSQIDPTINHAT